MRVNIKRSGKVFSTLLMLVALNSGFAVAQAGAPLEVYRFRPQRVGLGSTAVRLLRGLKTPVLYDVTLDSNRVTTLLPHAMEPRLERPDAGKIQKVLLTDSFMNGLKSVLRKAKNKTDITASAELAALFSEFQTHNFTITSDVFTFAKSGKTRMLDSLSKHAIISKNLHDVRFAGQMWRDGTKLCLNANSGTYMKKRKSAGMSEEPDHAKAIQLLTPIFAPALKVIECREIAPGFGGSEALDQAQKAELAVLNAESIEVDQIADSDREVFQAALTNARLAAAHAYEVSEAAIVAQENSDKNRAEYLRLDLVAAEAAAKAKEMRKIIEKILERALHSSGSGPAN